MRVLLVIVSATVAASLLFGVVWAVVGSRLGGGPEERERTLGEGPGPQAESDRNDPPAA